MACVTVAHIPFTQTVTKALRLTPVNTEHTLAKDRGVYRKASFELCA